MSGRSSLALKQAPPTRERFTEVYNEYFDYVSIALCRLGVPPATLDDACQDVFVVIHRRLGEFEGRSSFKTWLTHIAVNVAHNHRRQQRRSRLEALDEAGGVASGERSPHEVVEQSESVRCLYRLLEALDEDQRTVFVLADLEQLTAPEISQILEIKLNTVYSRLRLARQKVQAALDLEPRGEP